HTLGLSLGIVCYQIGIHLGHFLGNQSKGAASSFINLLFVPIADWLKSVECFTRFVHRLDVFLLTARGGELAKQPGALVQCNRVGATTTYRGCINIGDIGVIAISGLAGNNRADIDVVISNGGIKSRVKTDGSVGAASGVVEERTLADGSVGGAGGVGLK